MQRNPNPFNLSETGLETFNKYLSKVNKLRDKVKEQESINNQSPSFDLKRARSSVKYYSKLLEAHDSEVEERVNKVRKEAERKIQRIQEESDKEISFLLEKANEKKSKKEEELKEAEEKLREEEKKVPRNVLAARSELMAQIKQMLSALPIPRYYFPELGEAAPPPTQSPPLTRTTLAPEEMPLFGGERELANMRRLAFQEAREREREREEREERLREEAIKKLELERRIQEEQDRKRQDERRKKELEANPPPPSIHSSCASEAEQEESEEQFLKDLEECRRIQKERLVKPPLPPLPPAAPPPKPKKPLRFDKRQKNANLYQIPDE